PMRKSGSGRLILRSGWLERLWRPGSGRGWQGSNLIQPGRQLGRVSASAVNLADSGVPVASQAFPAIWIGAQLAQRVVEGGWILPLGGDPGVGLSNQAPGFSRDGRDHGQARRHVFEQLVRAGAGEGFEPAGMDQADVSGAQELADLALRQRIV